MDRKINIYYLIIRIIVMISIIGIFFTAIYSIILDEAPNFNLIIFIFIMVCVIELIFLKGIIKNYMLFARCDHNKDSKLDEKELKLLKIKLNKSKLTQLRKLSQNIEKFLDLKKSDFKIFKKIIRNIFIVKTISVLLSLMINIIYFIYLIFYNHLGSIRINSIIFLSFQILTALIILLFNKRFKKQSKEILKPFKPNS